MPAVPRQIIFFVGLILSALVCIAVAPFLRQTSGALGPTAITAASPATAVIALLVALAVATAIGLIVGRTSSASGGLFVVGFGLAVLSLNVSPLQEVAFHGRLGPVVISIGVWACVLFLISLLMFRVCGPLPEIQTLPGEPVPDPLRSSQAWQSCACGLIVLPVVWLIARSPTDGQALAAVTVGGIAVGLVGRLVSPSVQPVLLFAAPCAAGFFGALWGWYGAGPASQLADAYVTRSISSLSYPMPLDYVAGSLMGVSMGVGWSRSFIQEEQPEATT